MKSKNFFIPLIFAVLSTSPSMAQSIGQLEKKLSVSEIKKEYYPSGKLESETPYTDNKRNGIQRHYYESGKVAYETTYIDGKKNGIQREYRESGKAWYEAHFTNGKLNGIQKFYDESGNVSREIHHTDGKETQGLEQRSQELEKQSQNLEQRSQTTNTKNTNNSNSTAGNSSSAATDTTKYAVTKSFSKPVTGNEYNGKYNTFVYEIIKRVYGNNYAKAPTRTICSILDGYHAMMIMNAWGIIESINTGYPGNVPVIEGSMKTEIGNANAIRPSGGSGSAVTPGVTPENDCCTCDDIPFPYPSN